MSEKNTEALKNINEIMDGKLDALNAKTNKTVKNTTCLYEIAEEEEIYIMAEQCNYMENNYVKEFQNILDVSFS